MKFMDAHVHLKNRNDQVMGIPELLQEMDEEDVGRVFLMPMNSSARENERMFREMKGHEDRFLPFAFLNPYHADCVARLEGHIKNDGAKGLKLHPVGDAFPADRAYLLDPLLEVCDAYRLHCIIHCTSDAPNSSPLQMERTARRWPNVTFQMAHMGGCWLSNDAIKVCGRNDNIYLDGSTVSLSAVSRAVRARPERFLMGTDVPFYHFAQEKLKMQLATKGMDPAVREQVMSQNMQDLIEERGWNGCS